MPRRIQIRVPRSGPEVNAKEAWTSTLEPAIKILLSGSGSIESNPKLEYIHLYRLVYKLVLQGSINLLRRNLSAVFHDFLEAKFYKIAQEEALLIAVCRFWQEHNERVLLVRDVFLYADRDDSVRNIPQTQIISNTNFYQFVEPLLPKLIQQYVEEVRAMRIQDSNSSPLLTTAMEMFRALTNDIDFGPNSAELKPENIDEMMDSELVKDAENYFTAKTDTLRNRPVLEQLQNIDEWIEREKACKLYRPETAEKVYNFLVHDLTAHRLQELISDERSGMPVWLSNNDREAVKLAFEMERRAGTRVVLQQLAVNLENEQAQANAKFGDHPTEWIEATKAINVKYAEIAAFLNENSFSPKVAHSMCLSNYDKGAELLANYLDTHLKKSSEDTTDVKEVLETARTVYSLLLHTDFPKVYQRLLARRLLNNSSRSLQDELAWIRIMNEEDRGSYTLNFKKMIKDIELSRENFYGSDSIAPNIINTEVDVLSSNLWPKVMQRQLNYEPKLPDEIEDAKSKFEQFYANMQKDRLLKWNYSLSNAEIKLRVGEKTYSVMVPLVCMSILNLFGGETDENEAYSTSQIAELTGIPLGGELERHLKSLYLVPDAMLLVKNPPGKDVLPTDIFTFNTNFSSPKRKVKIRVVSAKSNAQQSSKSAAVADQTEMMLEQERSETTQAAILRIMKANNTMEHTKLMAKTATILQPFFNAKQPNIKRDLQTLMSRGYIERDPANDKLYHYVP